MSKRIIVRSFGSSDVLRIEDSEVAPQPNQIAVQVMAFGVNPVETYIRNGQYDPLPSLPFTPGNDGAGIVTYVGSDVIDPQVKIGDRVWITGSVSGTYAQNCLCNPRDVHRLPDALSFEQGAALGIPYRTADRALLHIAEAKPGESVLIHGATGGVGLAAIQISRMLGLSPIVATTSSSDPGIEKLLKDNGASIVCKHGAYTSSKVDIIIENLANQNLNTDLKLLNKRGRVVVVGNRGEVTINPRDLMRCEGSIRGMVGPGSQDEKAVIDRGIQEGIQSGQLRPVVGVAYPFEKVQEAHDEVIAHTRGTKGKIVVQPFQ